MLAPKRVKFRKSQRGIMKGPATRGNRVSFGDFGLQSLDYAWLSGRQLVACRFIEDLVERRLPAAERSEEAQWLHESPHMSVSVPKMVRAAGFADVRNDWVGQRLELESAEQFWDLQITFSSLARKRVAAAAEDAAAGLRAEFDRLCREVLAAGGSLVYPTGALLVSARSASLV